MSIKENSIQSDLEQLQKELFDLSARNPFIKVSEQKLWFYEDRPDDWTTASKIYSKAQFYKKEYALDTTLDVEVFLKWTFSVSEEQSDTRYFISPLLYRPCQLVRNRKIETTYRIDTPSENWKINPILRHFFSKNFDLELGDEVEDVALFLKNFEEQLVDDSSIKIESCSSFDKEECWQLIQQSAIGIFNYKKSLLGEDYKVIAENPNESVKALLGYDEEKAEMNGEKVYPISPLDESQRLVLQKALKQNFVIQGPPGTGKSHTIVALIANYLANDKKVLFVSEKRSALDVVFDRLKKVGLHHWVAYFNTEKDEKKAFYAHLKKAWEKVSQWETEDKIAGTTDFEKGDLLKLYPKGLLEENERLGGNRQSLIERLREAQKSVDELASNGRVPYYQTWKEHGAFLLELEQQIQKSTTVQSIQESPFFKLNKSVFMESDPILVLEKRLNKILGGLDRISYVQKQFELDLTLNEITRFSVAASIMGMVNRTQLDLLSPEHKSHKSFSNWAKKYELVRNKLKQAESANKKWTSKPTQAEITELIDLLKNVRPSRTILGLLKRRSHRLTEVFKDFDPKLTNEAKIQLLESVRNELNLRSELEEISLKMKHNLSIQDPDHEIGHIIKLRNKLDELSQNEYLAILEHERSLELIQNLDALHPIIQDINNLQRFMLASVQDGAVGQITKFFKQLQEELPELSVWQGQIKQFFALPAEIQTFLADNHVSIEELDAKIAYANLIDQSRFETRFKDLAGEDLLLEIKKLIPTQKKVHQTNQKRISARFVERYRSLEKLATTAASKLKEKEKDEKKRYKGQKRIIVHEINKRQQHLPLKELFQHCNESLLNVQSVWMMNPLAVSGSLPCKADLFDVVIFDEASQIPLEDAIPSVYRAKQMVVVGDSEQMPPSRFFSSSEENRTVLDQAEGVFKGEMLKWHYRSQHPALIHFSNQNFYENELLALPPVMNHFPIDFYKVEGVFENGKNSLEAKRVAEYIVGRKNTNQTLGVIAFSKEQEKEIEKQLDKLQFNKEGLLLRNLENVQGIECDEIVISIGYGPNPEGVFRLNFGPVNRDRGANRLNVLFSRAIQKMTVFSSVEHTQFKLSDNRGVRVLKDFLMYAQNQEVSKNVDDFNLSAHQTIAQLIEKNNLSASFFDRQNGIVVSAFVQEENAKILLIDPCLGKGEVRDLYDVVTTLNTRFKEIKIVLSMDLWKDKEKVEREIIRFLKN